MNNQQPTRRTNPLIQRPTTSNSNLGNAISSALQGMGMNYPIPSPPAWVQGIINTPPTMMMNNGGQHPLPMIPNYNQSQNMGGNRSNFQPGYPMYPPQQQQQQTMHTQYQQHQQQHYPFLPSNPFPQQQQFYPLQHQQQQYSYPPSNAYGSTSTLPPLRMTAEGYTISSSYVTPTPTSSVVPTSSSSSRPQHQPSTRGGHNNRGGKRGGGGGGVPSTPREKAIPTPPAPKIQQTVQPPPPPPTSSKIKCSNEGCTYEGNKRDLREHEEDRHLIFEKGREPKVWNGGGIKSLEGARIEGSNISLDSPEAIAKWIEDRKKRWPSFKVVEEKEQQRATRISLGLESNTRGGRGRGGRENSRGTRGGGRDSIRGSRGGSFNNRGTSSNLRRGGGAEEGENTERETKRLKVEKNESSDDDSSSSDEDDDDEDSDTLPETSSSKIEVASMFDLKPIKMKEDQEELEGGESSNGARIHPSRIRKDGDLDEEEEGGTMLDFSNRIQVTCGPWKRGHCPSGDNCNYLHSLPNGSTSQPPKAPLHQNTRKRPAPALPPHNPFARTMQDPFSQLAEKDISKIISNLLQVLDFLKSNQWLKGVESRVGEIDEEGGVEELMVVSTTTASKVGKVVEMSVEESVVEVEELEDVIMSTEELQEPIVIVQDIQDIAEAKDTVDEEEANSPSVEVSLEVENEHDTLPPTKEIPSLAETAVIPSKIIPVDTLNPEF